MGNERMIAAFMAVGVVATAQAESDDRPKELDQVIIVAQPLDGLANLGLHEPGAVGSRLGLSLMDTPASVEILTDEAIDLKGDFTAQEAVTRATGFAQDGTPGDGGTSVSVRGFRGHGATVNLYDGTRLYVGAGTVTFPFDTWTLERIEVLRGPGSVVHGVGATGATINYIPKRPTFGRPELKFGATVGSNNLQRYNLGAGAALNDRIGFRIDGSYTRDDTDIDRADEQRDVVRAAAAWRVTDHLLATLSVDYAQIDDSAYWGTPLVDGRIVDRTREQNYNVRDGFVEYEDVWPRLNLDWKLAPNLSLRNDTYYMDVSRHWRNLEEYSWNPATEMVDRFSYLEILHDQEQLGNQTALGYESGRFRVSVGAEVNQIDFAHTNNSPFGGESSVPLTDFDPGVFDSPDPTTLDFESEALQWAAFLDSQVRITERLSLVAGLRFDQVDYERVDFIRGTRDIDTQFDSEYDDVTWRAGLVFRPVEALSFYGQYSTSVDSIGSIATTTLSQKDLELATGRQVEFGMKQDFWDHRGQMTIAVFDIVKENLLSRDPDDPAITRQIGQQSSRGIEVSVGVQVLDRLSVDANFAALNARFDEFRTADEDLSGNLPNGVPETTANLWVNWRSPKAWRVGGGVRYVGERFSDDTNTPGIQLPDYFVVDSSIGWQVIQSTELTLRVNNVLDSDDYVQAPYTSGQWILGPQRSVELGIRYRL